MVRFGKLTGAALALAFMVSGASAATLNFFNEATPATGFERGVVNGVPVTSANFGGETLKFIAKNGTADAFAYFDEDAGLGVCKDLDSANQCDPSNDDNLTTGETLSILFNGAKTLSNLIFRADGHGIIGNDRTLLFSINGNALAQTTFGALIGMTWNNVTQVNFGFFGNVLKDQYYIDSAIIKPEEIPGVPLPAAGLLLLSGLGGLAALGRRRKTKAALA